MATHTKDILRRLPVIFMATLCLSTTGSAQVPVSDDGYPVESLGPIQEVASAPTAAAPTDELAEALVEPLTSAELAELIGPIALYPDDLLAIVLPATTYPLQIVQAARFIEAHELDSTLEPDATWDESVVALLNYPDVIRLLNDDIDWTWRLGDAVIGQQAGVIGAIELFRDRAYVAGNLKSDDHQSITMDEGIIEIVPIEDDVIYVPYYDPQEVVETQPHTEYYYYPEPRPVYYYPYPASHSFSSGYFWGVTTAFQIGWNSRHLRVHHPSYWGHPYYGHSYYGHNYRRPNITVYNTLYVNNSRHYNRDRDRHGDYWRPRSRSGSRPSDYRQYTRSYQADLRNVQYMNSSATTRRVRTTGDSSPEVNLRQRNRGNDQVRSNQNGQRSAAASNSNRRENRGNSDATRTTEQPAAVANRRQGSADRNQNRRQDDAIRFRERPQTSAAARTTPASTRVERETSRPANNNQSRRSSSRATPRAEREPTQRTTARNNTETRRAPSSSRPATTNTANNRRREAAAAPRTEQRQSQPARNEARAQRSSPNRSSAASPQRASAPPKSQRATRAPSSSSDRSSSARTQRAERSTSRATATASKPARTERARKPRESRSK